MRDELDKAVLRTEFVSQRLEDIHEQIELVLDREDPESKTLYRLSIKDFYLLWEECFN